MDANLQGKVCTLALTVLQQVSQGNVGTIHHLELSNEVGPNILLTIQSRVIPERGVGDDSETEKNSQPDDTGSDS